MFFAIINCFISINKRGEKALFDFFKAKVRKLYEKRQCFRYCNRPVKINFK